MQEEDGAKRGQYRTISSTSLDHNANQRWAIAIGATTASGIGVLTRGRTFMMDAIRNEARGPSPRVSLAVNAPRKMYLPPKLTGFHCGRWFIDAAPFNLRRAYASCFARPRRNSPRILRDRKRVNQTFTGPKRGSRGPLWIDRCPTRALFPGKRCPGRYYKVSRKQFPAFNPPRVKSRRYE